MMMIMIMMMIRFWDEKCDDTCIRSFDRVNGVTQVQFRPYVCVSICFACIVYGIIYICMHPVCWKATRKWVNKRNMCVTEERFASLTVDRYSLCRMCVFHTRIRNCFGSPFKPVTCIAAICPWNLSPFSPPFLSFFRFSFLEKLSRQ